MIRQPKYVDYLINAAGTEKRFIQMNSGCRLLRPIYLMKRLLQPETFGRCSVNLA